MSNLNSDALKAAVEFALLANGAGHPEFNQKNCRCDWESNAAPCEYCAIQRALEQTLIYLAALPKQEPSGWRPIASAPKDEKVLFWLDWSDDCKELNDPMAPVDRLFLGKYGGWSSVFQATYWFLLDPPKGDE
jgi:hypothetical protein